MAVTGDGSARGFTGLMGTPIVSCDPWVSETRGRGGTRSLGPCSFLHLLAPLLLPTSDQGLRRGQGHFSKRDFTLQHTAACRRREAEYPGYALKRDTSADLELRVTHSTSMEAVRKTARRRRNSRPGKGTGSAGTPCRGHWLKDPRISFPFG